MENLLNISLIPLALLLDKILGELPTRFHPVAIMGTWTTKVEKIFRHILSYMDKNSINKSKYLLRFSGMLSALCAIIPFIFIPIIIIIFINSTLFLTTEIKFFLTFLVALLCLYLCIAPRSLAEHALNVANPLEQSNIIEARKAVSAIVGRSTQNMDSYAVARACVESVGENVTDSVLSSLFWVSFGLIFYGFTGAIFFVLLHRCFNTLDAMWGKRNEKYQYFGTFAARVDDILNFLPARLSLLSITLAACFTKNTDYKDAWRVGYAYRYAHNSPNSAWSEAAFAGALGLKLGGPVQYENLFVDYPYFGDGTPNANAHHIHLAIKIMWNCVWIFSFVSCIMIYFLT